MRFPKLKLPLRTTLLYMLFGGLWILVSDQILSRFIFHDAQQAIYQTLKDWFFVLVSGSLLYLLLFSDLTKRKQSEEALRESEERFSKAFYQSPIGIILIDMTDGTIQDVNDTILEMLGLPRGQVIGQNDRQLGLQIDPEVYAVINKELSERGVFRNKEIQVRLPNGESRHVLNSGALITIRGKPYNLALVQDVTERKHAEQEMAWLASFPERNPNPIIEIDSIGTVFYMNPAAQRMFPDLEVQGFKHPWLTGLEDVIIRFQHEEIRDLQREIQIGDAWYSQPLHYVSEAARLRVYGTDITEHKRAEEQIQRQLKHLSALRMIDIAISSSFDLNVILDVVLQQVLSQLRVDASAIMLFNTQLQMTEYAASRGFRSDALRHTRLKLGEGYASQAVLSRKTIHISALMETGSKLARALQLANEEFVDYYGVPLIVKGEVKGVLEIYHRSYLKPDAEWLEFLEALAGQAAIAIDNAQLFENLQRSNLSLEVRVVERTAELNRTNTELEHANRIKDEFLANMSHELRTPLTSILGLSESLLEQRRGSLNDHQEKSLAIIESSGRHLLELINDILDLSKIEAGKFDFYPQPILVDDICRSSLAFVKTQAAKKSITITYHQDTSISKIFADPRRLKQILVNLLSNAVKFTLEQGEVILQVNADLEQDLIKFSVIDNGIGIAIQDLRRLFQPFVQVDSGLNRQHEGTGLGLALVQKLTDLHGGSVQVESELGKGSRFTVNLPCLQEEVMKLEEHESQPLSSIRERDENTEVPLESPAHLGVILLADDNMSSILTIGEYVESHGYKVVVAHDGSEALKQAEAIHPDLILMDIQMPVMNGLEAIARLRGDIRFADTPIIALTALAMPGDRERSLLAGANEYMSKPVSLKRLVIMIKELSGKQE